MMEVSAERRVRYSELGERLEPPEIVRLMNATLDNPGLLSLAAGFTDTAILPARLVAELAAELAGKCGDPEYLQYGLNAGRPGLRKEVVKLTRTYPGDADIRLSAEEVMITNGSQQALYVATQVLCNPGDIVLVEQPTYFVFLAVLKGLRARAVSMPMTVEGRIDFRGLRELLERLEAGGERDKLKALYTVTYYANPSSRCVAEEDKREMARLLHELDYALPVIEDSAYRELYFEEAYPAPCVLSMPEFDDLPCLYSGTFTKPFATGMKVGFACSRDSEWLGKMLNVKGQQDFGTANFCQAIIEEALTSGRYAEFLESSRAHYSRKMEVLHGALEQSGLREAGWRWEKPEGGLLMWLEGPRGFDTGVESGFCRACLENGVIYVPGDLCFADGRPENFVRLSVGTLDENGLREGARRFAEAARQTGE